jgi:sugar lactone lactonase YvrE
MLAMKTLCRHYFCLIILIYSGFCSLNIQAQINITKKEINFLKLIKLPPAPDIVQAEYYIDSDPGFGNATTIPLVQKKNLANLNFGAVLSEINTGIHQLHIRAMDANGDWSLNNSFAFARVNIIKLDKLPPVPDIIQAEYYIDSDPGFGNAINIPLVQKKNLKNLAFSIDLSKINTGIHQLHIRALDANGGWSLNNSFPFAKVNLINLGILTPPANIILAEYYIDTDPGIGNAINIPITPGTDISKLIFNPDISKLSTGLHQLHIRALDANGSLSLNNAFSFGKVNFIDLGTLPPAPNMVLVEYYIDMDPGFGNAVNVPFTPGTDISNLTFNPDISKLNAGMHQLHIRGLDANGSWSLNNLNTFTVNNIFTSPIITTIAGNGVVGYSGDGGPATSAELNNPFDVALDQAGNIYFSDNQNSVIRKINVANGAISTIAGNGIAGFSGDGGPATSAELHFPDRIAMDNLGNIYLCDNLNGRLREINASTGIITTVAAGLLAPTGVAIDVLGNIYITEFSVSRVRMINHSTGSISIIAGNGTVGYTGDGGPATAAELNSPSGVAVDKSGNIYISDQFNSAIREINAATGLITTIVGNGTAGFSGDGGPASAALINHPGALNLDASGNLFFADQFNSRIRKISITDGSINTVAGNGTEVYSGDGGPAIEAGLVDPSGVAIDAVGNILIADHDNRIRKVWIATPPPPTILSDSSIVSLGQVKTVETTAADSSNGIISIYPDPVYSLLNISLPANFQGNQLTISIYNTLGQLMQIQSMNSAGNIIQLDVSRLVTGTYMVTIKGSKTFKAFKFIKV